MRRRHAMNDMRRRRLETQGDTKEERGIMLRSTQECAGDWECLEKMVYAMYQYTG